MTNTRSMAHTAEKRTTNSDGHAALLSDISALWQALERGESVDIASAKSLVNAALDCLSTGAVSVVQRPEFTDSECQNDAAQWSVNRPLKQAILMAFRFFNADTQGDMPIWWDKIPLLQDQERWKTQGIRVVPGAFIRHGAYLGTSCIIMPSFINMGAYIGNKTMIDGGAHIGSCAFIGDRCHISANVTIGGVLEPLQAMPVIIEDDVFIGAGCHVVEGIHIGKGSILGSGVILTASTKIIHRATGEHITGRIPEYSALIPGTYSTGTHGLSIACAIVTKKTAPGQSPKTALTDALRD